MEKTISIINYGMGNIGSVENAVSTLNFKPTVVDNPENLNSSDKIILPGVGSFKTAMKLLNEGRWTEKIKECVLKNKIPIFGICLGMQLLADTSEEFGLTEGLKLIPGQVKDLKNLGCKHKLPQIGWNSVALRQKHKYLENIPNNTDFYFVNSFVYRPKNILNILGTTNYGTEFCSIISEKNIFGTQFHPEKSSKVGLRILSNFLNA
tara:strand:- start:18026 stop:18646 length:621 start_codon:yes stop_codon:yes gene_type:complete